MQPRLGRESSSSLSQLYLDLTLSFIGHSSIFTISSQIGFYHFQPYICVCARACARVHTHTKGKAEVAKEENKAAVKVVG